MSDSGPTSQPLVDRRILAAYANSSLKDEDLPRNQEQRHEALLAIAEVEYRLNGTSKCSICRAPVRAAMRSVGVDPQGKVFTYVCLCRRCLEGEKAYCAKITSYIAGLVFDEFVNRKEPVPRSAQTFRKAIAA